MDMPGLELSMPQAVRLWSLGPDDCRSIVDALVDSGFLRWTPRRTIMRTGREPRAAGTWRDGLHIHVEEQSERDTFVDRD